MGRSTLPANTTLQGRYRVKRMLGCGGFGITYYGHDVRLDRPVAVKDYFPEQFASRDNSLNVAATSPSQRSSFDLGRGWFLREAQTLAKYRHPNIVAVLDHFEENATAYMVLAYERGRPLTHWLADLQRPPSQTEIDAINLPLLSALEAMHEGGHLHRDVATDNIILRPDGSPVLIDFGSARQPSASRPALRPRSSSSATRPSSNTHPRPLPRVPGAISTRSPRPGTSRSPVACRRRPRRAGSKTVTSLSLRVAFRLTAAAFLRGSIKR